MESLKKFLDPIVKKTVTLQVDLNGLEMANLRPVNCESSFRFQIVRDVLTCLRLMGVAMFLI